MEQHCYLYELDQEVIPSNEIEEIKYFDLKTYLQQSEQVVGVIEVFKNLHYDKLLWD